MTSAALLAYAGTRLLHVHQGQWAVITCLVVVQGTIASTLDASLSRISGTIVGALVGGLGVFAGVRTGLPQFAVLAAAVAPMAMLAAADARFRLAPVTAALVVLAVSGGEGGYGIAIDRVAEILLGAAIGLGCTILVFPERARDALQRHAADALAAMGAVAKAHLLEGNPDLLQARMEVAFSKAQIATNEVVREQAVRLGRGAPPRPLMTALRRLRTDVALIERAMLLQEVDDRETIAADIGGWFADAAMAMRSGASVPAPPHLQGDHDEDTPGGLGPFAFALSAMRRDQSHFQERVEAWAGRGRPKAA